MNRGKSRSTDALDPFYIELGRRISRARKSQNRTQEEIAACIGLTRTSITNVEKGRQKLLIHKVVQIAGELRVDLNDLIPLQPKAPGPLDGLTPEKRDLVLRAIPEFGKKVEP